MNWRRIVIETIATTAIVSMLLVGIAVVVELNPQPLEAKPCDDPLKK